MHFSIYWDDAVNGWVPNTDDDGALQLIPDVPDPLKYAKNYYDALVPDVIIRVFKIE